MFLKMDSKDSPGPLEAPPQPTVKDSTLWDQNLCNPKIDMWHAISCSQLSHIDTFHICSISSNQIPTQG